MDYTDQEKEIAKKFQRITGRPSIGIVDILRILTGPDMLTLTKTYVLSKEG